jgi:Sugar-transfer associated ATP-grasp
VAFPWFQFAHRREPLPRLRKLMLELESETTGIGSPNFVAAFLLFFPVSLRQIWIAWRQNGQRTRSLFRVGFPRQFADLLYVSWRLNHSPHDYYFQKMWLRPDRRSWSQFFSHREHVAFVKYLQCTLPIGDFDDKLKFFHRMKAAGVPTIEVLFAASGGRWLDPFGAPQHHTRLPQDLVMKPADGAMYEGVEIWRYDAPAATYTRSVFATKNGREQWTADETLDLAGLLERMLTLSLKRTYLMQGRLKNNPALDPLSPHQIANFRIVTAQRGGAVKVIAAVLRMGYDRQKFIPSTYQANIDLETGTLGIATGRLPQWGFGENHVETGARVTGERIGRWPQLKANAIRGHEQYPWMPTIGWDAIDTEQGPMLMEANAFWGADIAQIGGPFLGEVGYAEACLEAYDRETAREPAPPEAAGSR